MVRRCIAGAAVLLWTSSALAAPDAHDPAAAREQLKIGYQLAQDNKCADALPHLTESLRLDPRAITLINLADCEEKTGALMSALGHWKDAQTRANDEGQKPIVEEAGKRAATLDPKIPRLTLQLAASSPKDATVERDGKPVDAATLGQPVMVDPGSHSVVVHAPGHDDAKTTYTLGENEKRSVDLEVGPANAPAKPVPPTSPVEPPREATKRKMSPLVPIGFGVGAAGVAVGVVTGILAMGKASDVKDGCPNNHCANQKLVDEASSGKTLGTVSTIAFIVGGVGVGVGVVGLFTGKKEDSNVGIAVGPGNVMLRGSF